MPGLCLLHRYRLGKASPLRAKLGFWENSLVYEPEDVRPALSPFDGAKPFREGRGHAVDLSMQLQMTRGISNRTSVND